MAAMQVSLRNPASRAGTRDRQISSPHSHSCSRQPCRHIMDQARWQAEVRGLVDRRTTSGTQDTHRVT